MVKEYGSKLLLLISRSCWALTIFVQYNRVSVQSVVLKPTKGKSGTISYASRGMGTSTSLGTPRSVPFLLGVARELTLKMSGAEKTLILLSKCYFELFYNIQVQFINYVCQKFVNATCNVHNKKFSCL